MLHPWFAETVLKVQRWAVPFEANESAGHAAGSALLFPGLASPTYLRVGVGISTRSKLTAPRDAD
jgi:hypothetical protein